jgi:short-subunit dehydrogenase
MSSRSLAVVTGASSGIGRALASQLSQDGYAVVLVARGSPALVATADELNADGRGCAEVVLADLATDEGIDCVVDLIARRRPDLVVNSAGSGWHGPFSLQTSEELDALLRLDVVALAQLSRAAFAVMIERGTGSLLNVSSIASFIPGPSVAAYHASKAFVTSLSEALHVEATGTEVHVTALCPGITPTGFQARAGTEHGHLPGFLTMTPDRVAREGLAALRRNDALCVTGAAYKAIAVLAKIAPRLLVRRIAGAVIAKI